MASSTARSIAGGLLTGLGQGIVARAARLREDALLRARELREDKIRAEDREVRSKEREEDREFQRGMATEERQWRSSESQADRDFTRSENQQGREFQRGMAQEDRDWRSTEAQTERDWRSSESEADRGFRRGLIADTVTDADRNLRGITAGGDVIDTGVKMPAAGAGGGGGAIPDEIEVAEWLARNRAAAEGREPTNQDILEAHATVRRAKENPQGKATLVLRVYEATKSDPTDRRPDEDKRRAAEEWVNQLLEADEPSRGTPRGGSSSPAPRADAASPQVQVQGEGTREAPYRPTTREQFDALPSGAIYLNPADGQLYRKN